MGYPHEFTFKVKLAIIPTRVFFTVKRNIYTCVLIYYLSNIHVVSYLVWTDLLCCIIFHTHTECICRWKFIKNKKREKWSMPITRTKHVQLFWKDNQSVTFNEPKSTLKKGYNWFAYLWRCASFSGLVLWEVCEHSWNLSTCFVLSMQSLY